VRTRVRGGIMVVWKENGSGVTQAIAKYTMNFDIFGAAEAVVYHK
jgi:hypothetical protein